MPVDPAKYEAYATRVARIYLEAETAILTAVAGSLRAQLRETDWGVAKLSRLRYLRRRAEAQVKKLQKMGVEEIRREVERAYMAGARAAEQDLRAIKPRAELRTGFGVVHTAAIEAIAAKTVDTLAATHLRILRSAEDVYRRVIADAAPLVNAGTHTRVQATQAALRRFADRGIGVFQDRAGRVWDISSYAEMATRSATGQAAVEGHLTRLKDNDYDLVIVSYSPEPCPLCEPWEGRILSVSGQSPDYPSVADARNAGMWHPNCTHSVGAYVPGLTKSEKVKKDPAAHQERQQQRYNERQIRRWKRREATAITEQEQQMAAAKVSEWQARQAEFLRRTGRRRKLGREQI